MWIMQAGCGVCNLSTLWTKALKVRVQDQLGLPKEVLCQEEVGKFFKALLARWLRHWTQNKIYR